MISFLLDLLFPRHSLTGCEGKWITDSERRAMRTFPLRLHKELLRKRDLKHLDCLIAAGSYSESPLLKKAIHTFKYRRIKDLGPDLAQKISTSLPGLLLLPEKFSTPNPNPNPNPTPPVLCPVPLHWTRKFHRGFNQAEIIAGHLSEKTGWPAIPLLKRSRPTGHQAHRTRPERFEAMRNAFVFDTKKDPCPSCVLLVDDVFTTGSTLDNCAKALKKAGAKYVAGLVVAHG